PKRGRTLASFFIDKRRLQWLTARTRPSIVRLPPRSPRPQRSSPTWPPSTPPVRGPTPSQSSTATRIVQLRPSGGLGGAPDGRERIAPFRVECLFERALPGG